jgi:hypothetical protein
MSGAHDFARELRDRAADLRNLADLLDLNAGMLARFRFIDIGSSVVIHVDNVDDLYDVADMFGGLDRFELRQIGPDGQTFNAVRKFGNASLILAGPSRQLCEPTTVVVESTSWKLRERSGAAVGVTS